MRINQRASSIASLRWDTWDGCMCTKTGGCGSLKSILYIFVFQGSLETRLHILHKKKKLIQINQWKSLKLGFPLILIPHH